jgi:large subunit ribosomal protein L31
MKKDIHPIYNDDTKIACACGNKWITGSTLAEINLEICSNCHPFYSGKDTKVDRGGRLQRFKARQEKHQTKSKTSSSKTVKRAVRATKKEKKKS